MKINESMTKFLLEAQDREITRLRESFVEVKNDEVEKRNRLDVVQTISRECERLKLYSESLEESNEKSLETVRKLKDKISELETENTVLKNETIIKLEGEIADMESQFGRRLDEVARKLSSRESVISDQVRRIIELENEVGSYKIIESMSKEEPAKRGRKPKGEVQ